jgi:hypothetical protein
VNFLLSLVFLGRGELFNPETKNDFRLIGRAMRAGWNVPKEKVIAALVEALQDPDLMVDAAKLLIAADALDIRREELEAKTSGDSESRRLQLLAIAQRVPANELARLASQHRIGVTEVQGANDGSGSGQGPQGS